MSPAAGRWVVLVATFAAVLVTVRLGVWQLSRAAQKEALQQSLQTRGELAPVPIRDLARAGDDTALQLHRRTVLTGRWLPERTVFLENRQMEGRPGFFVLTPLELSPGDAVVVQRGWAPRDLLDRTRLPVVPTPEGVVSVAGLIAPPPSALYAFGPDTAGPLRQNLDMGSYAREIGLTLRPWSLQQQGATDDGLMRQWPAPAVDVHKHYGYAFQWFALATLLVLLYAWFQLFVPWRARRRAS
jgi:surfeit locus 1 family protein